MVEFELFIGATDDQKYQDALKVLSWCTSLPLTSVVAQQAGTIYQDLKSRNQLIEIRDILIAATAIANNLPLMTLNKKHFERINTLTLIPPPA